MWGIIRFVESLFHKILMRVDHAERAGEDRGVQQEEVDREGGNMNLISSWNEQSLAPITWQMNVSGQDQGAEPSDEGAAEVQPPRASLHQNVPQTGQHLQQGPV